MDIKASRLKSSAFSLNAIHKGAAIMRHAINKTDKNTLKEYWEEYFPTHFIYVFFAFNSLYNVDWEQSCKTGELEGEEYMIELRDEPTKHEMYLDFCFQNSEFVNLYKGLFIKMILGGNTKEEIDKILSTIKPDSLPKSRLSRKKYINDFINRIDDLIYRGKFDKDSVSFILKFLYKVRCNVFHGSKTVEDMQDEGQQNRFEVYASIIIAINQMVFSYLDYLCMEKEAFIDSLDDVFDSLI